MRSRFFRLVTFVLLITMVVSPLTACTGIRLKAGDGSVLFARTLEWGAFDLESEVVVVPRGYKFTSKLDDGKEGMSWRGTYGVVGLNGLNLDVVIDGMNETGLTAHLFYHPGFAKYPNVEAASSAQSVGPLDVVTLMLTTCQSLEEVRAMLKKVHVVNVVEPALGFAPPIHVMVNEPSGESMVIEFVGEDVQVYDSKLGVITNAPGYDWHLTNLRNYLNLSPVALPDKKIEDMDFAPLGAGTGMIGLPGDFTPPSRFVRAVAFSASARPTPTGKETFYEAFRILDNFNVPLEGKEVDNKGMRSSTLWTSAYDTKNLVMQYHTMNNRRVRQVSLKEVDFGGKEWSRTPMDQTKEEDIEYVKVGK